MSFGSFTSTHKAQALYASSPKAATPVTSRPLSRASPAAVAAGANIISPTNAKTLVDSWSQKPAVKETVVPDGYKDKHGGGSLGYGRRHKGHFAYLNSNNEAVPSTEHIPYEKMPYDTEERQSRDSFRRYDVMASTMDYSKVQPL